MASSEEVEEREQEEEKETEIEKEEGEAQGKERAHHRSENDVILGQNWLRQQKDQKKGRKR